MTVQQKAKQRFDDFHGKLFLSDLTMVHDIAGECSPNVTEAMKEKKKLAKTMALTCIDRELESLNSSRLSRILHKVRRNELHLERNEIANL